MEQTHNKHSLRSQGNTRQRHIGFGVLQRGHGQYTGRLMTNEKIKQQKNYSSTGISSKARERTKKNTHKKKQTKKNKQKNNKKNKQKNDKPSSKKTTNKQANKQTNKTTEAECGR